MRNESIFDAIVEQVEERPCQNAVVLEDGDGREHHIGYLELHLLATSLAAWLQSVCRPGDRVLLCYPTGIEFTRSLLACLYADVVPVPVPLPGRTDHHLSTITGIALDAEACLVLTDAAHSDEVYVWLTHDDLGIHECVATDVIEFEDASDWVEPLRKGEDQALLQYTVGPGGGPIGITVSHANVLHNCALIAAAYGLGSGVRSGGWLPLHHSMGLIALLLAPLISGGTAVLMPPETFCADPIRWLRLIDRHDVRFSVSPTFGYGLCVSEITDDQLAGLDLSRWRHALLVEMTGASPAEARTVELFAERLRTAGLRAEALRTSYGLAEATLLTAVGAPGGAVEARCFDSRALDRNLLIPTSDTQGPRLLGLGVVPEPDLRIVDPVTAGALPEGRIGEIWVRGPRVVPGYWRKERLTGERFDQVTADGEKGFVRSGNLGAIVRGELYVTGLMRDVSRYGGRYLDLGRVERAIVGGGSIVACSAFPAPADRDEIIVVAQPARAETDEGSSPLIREVRDILALRFGVHRTKVVLVKPGQVQVMPDGEVNRQLTRELFVANALDIVYADVAREFFFEEVAALPGTREAEGSALT
ncbi:AMP-binding protein [Streptosporangium sp. NPDC000239]|uniref:AMP-binding protein n=1 Tax=Streptosporangium jomthongense TaxID=1193683 RepID=A0ABV8F8T0_9ACTN